MDTGYVQDGCKNFRACILQRIGRFTAEYAKGAEELGHTAAVAVLRGDRHTSTSTQNDAVEEEEELSFFTPPARRRRSE